MHNRLLSQNFYSLHQVSKELDDFDPKKEADIQLRKALKTYVGEIVKNNSAELSALQKVFFSFHYCY